MDIQYKTRQFTADEQLFLMKLKAKMDNKQFSKIKYHFLIAMLLGIGFTFLVIITLKGFELIIFVYELLAFVAYGFSYLLYGDIKRHKHLVNGLNLFIDKGTVDTCLVNAKRIAVAGKTRHGEDVDNDIFIIEYDDDKVLFLHDISYYKLRNKFPCLDFEIYEDKFSGLIEKLINPLSEPVKPLTINESAKSRYIRRYGELEHLQIQNISFDKIVAAINNCV